MGAEPDAGASDTNVSDVGDAATPDAPAPALVTLRETQSDTYAGGAAWCIESAGTVTNDENFERVFPLASFGISARFYVTAISFLVASAHRADSIAVRVGTYTGSVGGSTLDTSMMQWSVAAPLVNVGDVTSTTGPTMETVAITPPMIVPATPGEIVLVSVASPNYEGMGGKTFQLASTTGAEGTPSYWTSVGCGNPAPSKTDIRNGADVGTFVIDVIGYVQ